MYKSNHECSAGKWRWAWKEYSRDQSKPIGCVIQIIMGTEIPKVVSVQNIYLGHVQKRWGTRLRKLKKTEKSPY